MGLARVAWAGVLVTGAVGVGLGAMKGTEGPAVDGELFELLNRGHGRRADAFFGGVTELGSLYAAGAAAGVMAATGRPRTAANAIMGAATTWLLLQGIKEVIDRPRPSDTDPEGTRLLIARPRAMSWPSSHPAVLTTVTRIAARELDLGPGARAGLTGLDLSVAASRVYLGVHYPSDVVSGLLIGRAVARLWPRRRSR